MHDILLIGGVVIGVLGLLPVIMSLFLRDVEAGTIRLVSWLHNTTVIYRGPGKSKEIPLLSTGTTIPSQVFTVDLDITDQSADLDEQGGPRPIKVRLLASAMVSVGESDAMITTATNRFFAKPEADQLATLTDLLSSAGRRAINLLTHDQLFSAKTIPRPLGATQQVATGGKGEDALVRADARMRPHSGASSTALQVAADFDTDDDDDPLSIIIRKACSRTLTDLGLNFNSFNIKVVQSEVAEARRRQAAAEAQANADIAAVQQSCRAKEAQIEAELTISARQRDVEQTRAAHAAVIAQAEAERQEAMAVQRAAELDATLIAQAKAEAERVKIEAQARAEAEAIRIRTVAEATAESIQQVNAAIREGGESYLRYRQVELLPDIAPLVADALAKAKMVIIAGGGGSAAEVVMSNISSVIQTVLAAQFVTQGGLLSETENSKG